MMNNTTIVELIMTTNITGVITNHTSDAFQLIPMNLFTYISLVVFKLYNSCIS